MVQNALQTLLKVSETSSTTAKQQILRDNKDDIQLQHVLKYALDPFMTFGVKNHVFGKPIEGETVISDVKIFELCDELYQRKLTGNAARDMILSFSKELTNTQQRIFDMILSKDLNAGIAAKTVNKVWNDLIPEFNVQLASPHNPERIKYPCLVQPKYDGVRTVAMINNGEIKYFSRNGKQFLNFNCFDIELKRLFESFSKIVIDGEVVGPPGDEFRGIMQQCRRKYDVEPVGLNYHIFDAIPYDNFVNNKDCDVKQGDRIDGIGACFRAPGIARVKFVQGKICNSYEECYEYFEACIEDGYEGVIIKDLTAEYEFKRGFNWQKIKPTETKDFKVIDVNEGEGKYEGLLGAFIIQNGDVIVRVGSGLSDNDRINIEEAKQLYVGKTIEVRYDSETPDGSLRFPRFVRFREDKDD